MNSNIVSMTCQQKKKKKKKLIGYGCPECKSLNIKDDFVHMETYCHKCGLVLIAPRTPDTIVRGLKPVYVYISEDSS